MSVHLVLLAVLGADAGDLALRGDSMMRASRAQEALSAYDEALLRGERNSRTLYNRACALRELGRTEEAEEGFREAWKGTRDARLAGDAAFNLGRSLLERAKGKVEEDRSGAMGLLGESAGAFLEAARARPGDREALRGLEVARRMLRGLEAQAAREEEAKREAAQRRQEMIDRLNELAREQDALAEGNEAAGERTESEMEEAARSQDDLGDRTEEAAGEDTPEGAREEIRRARESQEASERDLSRGDRGSAAERQREAAERLREAARRLEEESAREQGGERGEPREPGEGEEQEEAPSPQEGAEAEDPTQELLEQLLERERAERAIRNAAQRRGGVRGVPVDKDW